MGNASVMLMCTITGASLIHHMATQKSHVKNDAFNYW